MSSHSLLPDSEPVHAVDARTAAKVPKGSVVATDDPQLIREWARRHSAEPATGEATASGPATVDVHDGGAGVRFNFPAAAPFRPISWEEWFAHFKDHDLLFVYERDDGGPPSNRYRMVPRSKLPNPMAVPE